MKHVKSLIHLALVPVIAVALAACSDSLTDVNSVASTPAPSSEISMAAAKVSDGPADGNGIMNLIHGVPGAVVDVCASGATTGNVFVKITSDFEFTNVDTHELPEGTYDAKVIGATGDDSCAPAAIPGLEVSGVFLPAGANVSAVAHLTDGGDLTLSVFANEVAGMGPAVLAAHHTAQAPSVDVWLGRNVRQLAVAIEDFTNGDQVTTEILPGPRELALSLPNSDEVVFGPARLQLQPSTTYAVYAVGAFPSSFQFVILPISY